MMLKLNYFFVFQLAFKEKIFSCTFNDYQSAIVILAKMAEIDVDKVSIPIEKHLNYSEDFHLTNVQDFRENSLNLMLHWPKYTVHYQTWYFYLKTEVKVN